MAWTEALFVLLVCHVTGDFLLQTEFQATRKFGGLGSDPDARWALISHLLTYAVPMLAAAIYVGIETNVLTAIAVFAIAIVTHLVQDDGRLLQRYVLVVKHTRAEFGTPLWMAIDQSAHFVWLFLAALVASAAS